MNAYLEIIVAVDGSVAEVNAVEGTEPFTTQAIATARAWRFPPARRADVPTAARIRVRVEFRPPTTEPGEVLRRGSNCEPDATRMNVRRNNSLC